MIIKQTDVAKMLGVTTQTVRNYERQGILKRANVVRPGAWYESRDIAPLLGKKSRNAQHAIKSND